MNIQTGNLNQHTANQPEYQGWVISDFIKDPFFQSDAFEVKWAVHKKGDVKNGKKTDASVKTLGILISGKFLIKFPHLNKEVALEKMGDFLTYDSQDDEHIGTALEDTVIMAIRWPLKR